MYNLKKKVQKLHSISYNGQRFSNIFLVKTLKSSIQFNTKTVSKIDLEFRNHNYSLEQNVKEIEDGSGQLPLYLRDFLSSWKLKIVFRKNIFGEY